MFQLLGIVVLLAAIAPVAMAGGNMVAAFITRQHIVFWLVTTLAMMVLLVISGVLAIQVVLPMTQGLLFDQFSPLVSSLTMLAPPWALWFWARRTMLSKAAS